MEEVVPIPIATYQASRVYRKIDNRISKFNLRTAQGTI
jgi:hypothetical protein